VLKGDPLLVPAALSAAKQWRYNPMPAKFRSCGRDHDYRHRLQQQSVAAEAIARSVVRHLMEKPGILAAFLLPERDRFLEQRVVGYQNSSLRWAP